MDRINDKIFDAVIISPNNRTFCHIMKSVFTTITYLLDFIFLSEFFLEYMVQLSFNNQYTLKTELEIINYYQEFRSIIKQI